MDDKRISRRQRTFKGGAVSTPSGIIDCVIRNLSDAGALLEFSGSLAVPDTFFLIIKPELVNRACKVAWRAERRIGVRFTRTLS